MFKITRRIYSNSDNNSNWKNLLGFTNMQEKLEKIQNNAKSTPANLQSNHINTYNTQVEKFEI